MLEVLTPAEMGEADRLSVAAGPFDGPGLMRNAGVSVAAAILARFPDAGRIAILCGPGNNGGDGYVTAARLAEAGAAVVAACGGSSSEQVDNLVGRTSLIEAAAILADADVVVTNDSGLMHVASAFDRRIVALYGSSSEKMTPPTSPHAQIISRDLPCRPCLKRECPLGTLACLEEISPRDVFETVERIAR